MGIFSFIKTCKDESEIKDLLNKIYDLFLYAEPLEYDNPKFYTRAQLLLFENDLEVIVNLVRKIERICDLGDRHTLRVTLYRSRWSNRDKLGVIIETILKKVIAIRNNLSLPSVYQEELDVFTRYSLK